MVDFHNITSETRAYNFHAHTQWCDGRDSLQTIARRAADDGYRYFGFTPHSPIPIESPCNMSADDLTAYREAVEEMRAELGDRMQIYCGLEIDYLGREWGPSSPLFVSGDYDYSIGSVHFIPTQEGELIDIDGRYENFKARMEQFFHNDIRYVVETFYRVSDEMLTAGGFDILGHFDKVAQNAGYFSPGIEQEDWYVRLINDYIDHIVDSDVIVEINTKARELHGRFFPHERYWRRLIDAGKEIVVNSDAHVADLIGASRREAFEILDSMGYGKNLTSVRP